LASGQSAKNAETGKWIEKCGIGENGPEKESTNEGTEKLGKNDGNAKQNWSAETKDGADGDGWKLGILDWDLGYLDWNGHHWIGQKWGLGQGEGRPPKWQYPPMNGNGNRHHHRWEGCPINQLNEWMNEFNEMDSICLQKSTKNIEPINSAIQGA
jgi:hypothetical protein